jgi:hypothetical protein
VTNWIAGMAIALLCGVSGVIVWWKRDQPNWRPFVPWIVSTAAGIAVTLASYVWLFEQGSCHGRHDFVCIMNVNQGFTTFVALILAVAGLWVSAITREVDRRQARNEDLARARMCVEAALAETTHNLLHCATACASDGTFEFQPQLSVDDIAALLDGAIRRYVSPVIADEAKDLLRNFDRIEKKIHQDWAMRAFIAKSAHLLIRAGQFHPAWAKRSLQQPGLQDVEAVAKKRSSYLFHYRSSEAPEAELARARSEGYPFVCWIEDKPVPRLRTYALLPRFLDLAKSHRH